MKMSTSVKAGMVLLLMFSAVLILSPLISALNDFQTASQNDAVSSIPKIGAIIQSSKNANAH